MKKLSYKIAIAIIICSIVISAAIGAISTGISKKEMKEEAYKAVNYMVKNYSGEFSLNILRAEQSVEELENYIKSSLDFERFKESKEYRESYKEELSKYMKESVKKIQKSKSIYAIFNPEVFGGINDVWWIDEDSDGEPTKQKEFELSYYDGDRKNKAWYYRAIDEKKSVWIEPYKSTIFEGISFISYSKPIIIDGEVICVIGRDLIFNDVKDDISKISTYETGYAVLLDKNLNIVYHKDYESGISFEEVLKEDREKVSTAIKNKESGNVEIKSGNEILSFSKLENEWILILNSKNKEILKPLSNIQNITLIFILIGIILSVIVAYIIGTRFSKPIIEMMNLMKKAEEGDLTGEMNVKRRDEVGKLAESFNNMMVGQNKMIKEIMNSTQSVSELSEESSGAAEEISALAQTQASSVSELNHAMNDVTRAVVDVASSISDMSENINDINVSMSGLLKQSGEVTSNNDATRRTINGVTKMMEEINVSISEIAKNAKGASKQAENTVKVAKEGKETVNNTIKEIKSINQKMDNITDAMQSLGNVVDKIGNIIELIDDIAEQTNLLSLNASIEAARAGEHGKGFAVVAGAIGQLAEKSSLATKDIVQLIIKIRENVKVAIETTKEGARQVEKGVGLSKGTEKALEEIFNAVKQTKDLVDEIEILTDEQDDSSENIMEAIERVNDNSTRVSNAIKKQVDGIGVIAEAIKDLKELSENVAGAAEEQSASTEQVLATVETIDDAIKDVSKGSEEVAVNAENLALEANRLLNMMSKFNVEEKS